MNANHLFQPLFPGPIDIIGDVHGELDALHALLGTLGYDSQGEHPARRRLVFIGDLCDRGHDSPGVIALVRSIVERGCAQCLLGNHELNILRSARKDGNGWFFEPSQDRDAGRYLASRDAAPGERAVIAAFFASLPIVLARDDLRLVHAAWDEAALALLRECQGPTRAIYDAYATRAHALAERTGLGERAAAEWREHGAKLHDPATHPPLLTNIGRLDMQYQMANPLRIITSGPEQLTQAPFFASGKWRMLDRVKWWSRYRDDVPVMVGHYWRWPTREAREALSRGERDLFEGAAPEAWLGPRRNVFCLDFAVGARYKERAMGRSVFATRLGAVRWPERELAFDDGRVLALS